MSDEDVPVRVRLRAPYWNNRIDTKNISSFFIFKGYFAYFCFNSGEVVLFYLLILSTAICEKHEKHDLTNKKHEKHEYTLIPVNRPLGEDV